MDSITEKRCSRCKEYKLFDEFAKSKSGKYGLTAYCKACLSEYRQKPESKQYIRNYQNKWTQENYDREKRRDINLRANHGITLAQFNQMFDSQEGTCPICKNRFESREGRKINVDHNHKTGEVRELLCNHCNTLIGYAKENIETLMSAVLYLQKWNK